MAEGSSRVRTAECVAECFWPGVTEDALADLDARVRASAVLTSGETESVRYRCSMLLPSDEVVFCFFEGTAAAVRIVATRAGIPFERILEIVRVGAAASE